MPDDPGKSYEERLARYAEVWRTSYDHLRDSLLVRAWIEAVRESHAGKPAGPEPEPEAGTWRDRPPLL